MVEGTTTQHDPVSDRALLHSIECEQSPSGIGVCYATFIIHLCSYRRFEIGDTLATRYWRYLGYCATGTH